MAISILIGEFEQDYLYRTLKYKLIADHWRAKTTWGQLFQHYQKQGHLVD